jgi:hypothetical protein
MKKIFSKYIIGLLIGASTLSAGGCTDLSENIYDTVASEKYTFTEEDAASMFAPVYNSLKNVCWAWYSYFDLMDITADVWCIPLRISIGWGDLYVTFHKHEFHSQLAHLDVLWSNAYSGINACNKLLADPAVQTSESAVAQLRAYRAVYYYLLFDAFRNIPLDTQFDHPEGWMPEQATPQQTWDFIITELNEVKGKLGTSSEMGKMNDYAVNAILARMYLNHNAWFNDHSDNSWYGKAIDECNEIIASGKYAIAADYLANSREDISGSPEVIFGLPYEYLYGGGIYFANMWTHTPCAATWQFNGWSNSGAAVLPQFLNSYDPDDERYEACWITGPQYDYAGAPIMQDGTQVTYTRELHSIDNPGCYPQESERLIKYEIVSGDYGTSYDDVAFVRYAEILFMKAECLLRLGGYKGESTQVAADLVTQVRQRAFRANPAKATRTVAQLMGGSVYEYGHRENTGELGSADNWVTTTEGGADILLGGMLDDWSWEFVAEARRRQELIRFRMTNGQNVYNGKSWFCKDRNENLTDFHADIFPLPKSALDGNSKLKQNPGY